MSDEKFLKLTFPSVPENRYIISEYGKVYDTLKNRFLAQTEDKDGYFSCSIVGKHYRINRLVGWEFYPKTRDLSLVVDHKDGNKKNNHYTNLEWVTVKENTIRAQNLGLRNVRGEHSSTNVYPESLVHDICKMIVVGMTTMEIFYKITERSPSDKNGRIDMNNKKDSSLYALIYRVRRKQIWPDVVSQYEFPEFKDSVRSFIPKDNGYTRYNNDQVHYICKLIAEGKSVRDIVEIIEVSNNDPVERTRSYNAIEAIKSGRNWRNISSQYFEIQHNSTPRKKYNIDDYKLTNLIKSGYSVDEISMFFDIGPDDKLGRRAIVRRIRNYDKMNHMSNEITLSEL